MSTTSPAEPLLSCTACGATIYPEHLDRRLAGYWAGAIYCAVCLAEKKNDGDAASVPADEPISVPLEEVAFDSSAPAIATSPPPVSTAATVSRRPPRPDASGATRMRIFHARLSNGAIAHLDQQVNDWLEQNPEIEIKFANSTVGIWEGKHAEPNLILTLFY
ncbi:MAG TPA: hypothetical protein PKG54_12765 [Phycisphaerae bacterium]|jgi:hypothetical protein|nr:hypothetical protein [Phycisphaerae bacterium]HOB75383.1 hypothetical protein [Phycisphaerae bacterium]HOJ55945.1 hypothetical protein [Phycisphaerae bacterium]HOL26699.1 hypothetical protein [Phycisphaerae bacterium]HPP20552.1 hypothetical protein [Phycisphaerae bacterium]